ncbi:unnamed protein product, partial [Amoebophrya sp. A25]
WNFDVSLCQRPSSIQSSAVSVLPNGEQYDDGRCWK